MLARRFLPQGIRFYVKRLTVALMYSQCLDIDSPFVSHRAVLGKGVKIGFNTSISDNVFIDNYSYVEDLSDVVCAHIGKFCSIGRYCSIGAWEHPYTNVAMSPFLYRNILKESDAYSDTPSPVVIGNDVWVGNSVAILGGVSIGNGAVIGAGSVVTHDIPPYSIAVGIPAKVIKNRFNDQRIEEVEQSKWWDWSEDTIVKNRDFFIRIGEDNG